ncbi:MAG: hypothetical protein VX000_17215 [Myxococcota bacterium]|nr:hypothetical protein [Myxococcota bacterium]
MDRIAQQLAPLTLPRLDGAPVRLGSLWQDGPVVFAFLRHYG